MESKQISWDETHSVSTRYQSFIAQELESYNHDRVKELHGRRIRACFHGWVILSNHPERVLWSLWNPLTSKLIRLPPFTHDKSNHFTCCLSSPPDNHGSVLLLTTKSFPSIVFCRLDCKRKRSKWTQMSYAKQVRSISGVDCCIECLTCCNRKVYALIMHPAYEFVIEVDIVVKGKEVVISLLPVVKVRIPPTFSFHTINAFLKGSSTELFYMEVYYKDEARTMIRDVYLFKLDMTSMMWEEMEDLKDASFFIEFSIRNNSCLIFYKSIVAPEIGGYVHIRGEMDRIISFHVKDRTKSQSSRPFIEREAQVFFWAMLESRVEVDYLKPKQEEEYTNNNEVIVRPINAEFDSIKSESQLFNIPFHILETIMELCVVVEYMRFRATCKLCYLAAPPIQWSGKAAIKRLQMHSLVSPWLMMLDNKRGIITFIDPICGDRYFITLPAELNDGYRVYCSRYGWLLMYKAYAPVVFFNPFTSDIRKLPEVYSLDNLGFSAPPTSPDCIVAGFTRLSCYGVAIRLYVSKEPSWRMIVLDFGENDPYSYHFPILSGRNMYVLCDNNNKIEGFIDIIEETSRVLLVEKAPKSSYKSPKQYFLSNYDEYLFLVIVGDGGESVEVFKLNYVTNEWENIDDLGKHAIYISDASCICVEAKSPQMENKIYFQRVLDNEETKIVFYSLKTCTYHTFDNKNISESLGADLLKTERYYCQHTWIEPTWS